MEIKLGKNFRLATGRSRPLLDTSKALTSANAGAGFVDKGRTVSSDSSLSDRLQAIEERAGMKAGMSETPGRRKGLQSGYGIWSQGQSTVQYRFGARLTYSQLRQVYYNSSAVRPCVDGINRRISNTPWTIKPVNDEDFSKEHQKKLFNFFNNPNANKESLAQLSTRFLNDVLVIDAGAVEKVRALKGNLLELVARDGTTISPKVDETGLLQYYEQRPTATAPGNYNPGRTRPGGSKGYSNLGATTSVGGGRVIKFPVNDIIYIMMYPRTSSIYGTPIIDGIVDEVAALLFSNVHIARSFTEDEIPPGVLNLGEIGEMAYDRCKEDFRQKKGEFGGKDYGLKIVYGTKQVEWVDFKRANKEMQVAELRDNIERIVYRNFGVTPTEMGATGDINRSLSEAHIKTGRSGLYVPLLSMLEYYYNTEVVPEFGFSDVKFAYVPKLDGDEEKSARADRWRIERGTYTINDIRRLRNLPAYTTPNADRPFIIVGKEVVFVDELDKRTAQQLNQGKVSTTVEGFEVDKEEAEDASILEDVEETVEKAEKKSLLAVTHWTKL